MHNQFREIENSTRKEKKNCLNTSMGAHYSIETSLLFPSKKKKKKGCHYSTRPKGEIEFSSIFFTPTIDNRCPIYAQYKKYSLLENFTLLLFIASLIL